MMSLGEDGKKDGCELSTFGKLVRAEVEFLAWQPCEFSCAAHKVTHNHALASNSAFQPSFRFARASLATLCDCPLR